ncbi:protachykinin isoform X2 [Notolabrus celidotus]|uniref:protachykinin isoform X2 n=1 Tax=Notolabrus celidotus TaxID=1203425 RepID=UPI001490428A|nr:protachykinin isoform X2 [Notolabrus celidotus]
MELVKLVLVIALLLTNVSCQDKDVRNWKEGFEEDKWSNSGGIQDLLGRMTRKLGPRQHLGLMGKKEFAKTQTARKRHKFQTFVGLMGKRGYEDEGAF